jgi:hypothetical protein
MLNPKKLIRDTWRAVSNRSSLIPDLDRTEVSVPRPAEQA